VGVNSGAPEYAKRGQSEAVKWNEDSQYDDQRKKYKKTNNDVQNTTLKTKD